jgi:aspartyl-tRNA(Asn)/glutamyl-tRNA(Gln) amidotransferase subunit C
VSRNGGDFNELRPAIKAPRDGCRAKRLSAIEVAGTRPDRGRMSVDAQTVRRIAHLARIAVAEDEVEHLRGELNAILDFVEQLRAVNVDDVEPMTSVTPMAMKERADEVTDGDIADDIVSNAPAREDHFFVVPKVVE